MSSIYIQIDSFLKIYTIFNTSLIIFKAKGLPFFKEYLSKVKINWDIFSYENTVNKDGPEHLALVKGNLNNNSSVLVRVHISNLINDAFDGEISNNGVKNNESISLKESMSEINKNGSGLIVVINYQDSSHVLSSYIDGNNIWNEEDKIRENGIGAQIIRDQGVKEMILLSKSKREVVGLEGFDIKIIDQRNLL